jgi:hypothetical protein
MRDEFLVAGRGRAVVPGFMEPLVRNSPGNGHPFMVTWAGPAWNRAQEGGPLLCAIPWHCNHADTGVTRRCVQLEVSVFQTTSWP